MDNTDSVYVSQSIAAVSRRIEAVEWTWHLQPKSA